MNRDFEQRLLARNHHKRLLAAVASRRRAHNRLCEQLKEDRWDRSNAMKRELIQEIERMLVQANGKRLERILSVTQVLNLIAEAAVDGDTLGFTHGGEVSQSYNRTALTTLAFVVKVDDIRYLGLKACPAFAPSPGKAWKQLHPFYHGNMRSKLAAWISGAKPLVIDTP